MDILQIAQYASAITGIVAAVILLVKPLREWMMGTKALREGQKCLLRHNMLHIYYKNREAKQIRQYEFENFEFQYKAYKALGGNSFIDKIRDEVLTWGITS